MKRHVVLVGLPGSGKTTVGRRVAQLLKTPFSDLDEMVVSVAGVSVAEIFATRGEAHFRRLERAEMDRAIAGPPQVIAPGAGWIAEPGNLDAASGALLVYLEISPEAAAARLARDTPRPLLSGSDPAALIRELLARREAWYTKAAATIDASPAAESVARAVVEAVNRLTAPAPQ